jgi:hypothetical protein
MVRQSESKMGESPFTDLPVSTNPIFSRQRINQVDILASAVVWNAGIPLFDPFELPDMPVAEMQHISL